jgi:hypothetical protein
MKQPIVNFTNIFWCQSRAAFMQIIFDVISGSSIWQKIPKYGAQCQGCSLQNALKYWQKYWWKLTSFALLTL